MTKLSDREARLRAAEEAEVSDYPYNPLEEHDPDDAKGGLLSHLPTVIIGLLIMVRVVRVLWHQLSTFRFGDWLPFS